MKKWMLILVLLTGIISLAACGNGSDIVAETSAGNITKDDLYEEMKKTYGESILQQLIFSKILPEKYEVTDKEIEERYEQEKQAYGDSFEFVLLQSGLNEKSYKEILKLNILIEKAATEDVKVTNEEMKTYFEENYPKVHARHILVEDEKTAKEVLEKLKSGSKFEDLANEYSIDTGTAANGGSVGWFGPNGNFVQEFKDTALALKVDEISDPVESQFGFHIIQVTERQDPTFEEVKDEVEYGAKVKKTEEDPTIITDTLQRELKAADVKIKDKDLENIIRSGSTDSKDSDK